MNKNIVYCKTHFIYFFPYSKNFLVQHNSNCNFANFYNTIVWKLIHSIAWKSFKLFLNFPENTYFLDWVETKVVFCWVRFLKSLIDRLNFILNSKHSKHLEEFNNWLGSLLTSHPVRLIFFKFNLNTLSL